MVKATTSALQNILLEKIQSHGNMTFAEFMADCLYHPEHGYYIGSRDRIGKQGDFFTSSSVHALFGGLIARQLIEMAQILGEEPFIIVEQGAGEGHLAKDILDALQIEDPEVYNRSTYRLVEVSPDNRRRQREQLLRHVDRVDWCAESELQPFTGCYLCNELIDAFPVHVVEKREGKLQEVFVTRKGGELGETVGPLSTAAISEYFAWLGVEPAEGNRGEVNLLAVDWIWRVAATLQRGFVLTIDYGYPSGELYAPFRRNGTVMCYHKHAALEDPYHLVGEQDITAHVDFTALQKAGTEAGLELLYFKEQYRFLMALGFVDKLMQLQAELTEPNQALALRMTLKNLIMPDEGMGSTFKVLVQGKGVGTPELLCHRKISDIPLPI
ncbi:MAG: SAM-dependent methyltransferase [Desulfuromonadales bacterium]|nr:SAM-dependent methyltransferase [Desulfuromonadales bacterium]